MKLLPAQKGSILVEMLVVMVIISVVMVGLVTSVGNISRGQVKADRRLEATQYAIEGMELVFNYGYNNWSKVCKFSVGTPQPIMPNYSAANYVDMLEVNLSTSELIGGVFERRIYVRRVRRHHTTDEIVSAGGYEDPYTLEVESVVIWPDGEIRYSSYYVDETGGGC